MQIKGLAGFPTHALRKRNVPILAIAAVLGMAMCCSNALAQTGAGSIQGTVTDATGAVIPGAAIHVVNESTNVATDTKSGSIGFYQVPDLFTGTYSVTVTAPGMKTYVQTIDLLVAQNAVINPVMTVGSQTQQVTVAANVVQLVDTQNGVLSATLENARINQLPMNSRYILTLTAETTPGMEACNDGGVACVNGLMNSAMNLVADGVTLVSREYGGFAGSGGGGQDQVMDPDAIQEVKIQTSGVSAQYATPAMALMTTKSGTNSLHGSFFETARNNAWGIAKVRQDPSNYSAPHYVRNEFGASAGGPIVIPHLYHGKDKSFWFFAYERYSLGSEGYELLTVPTMAMRNGDWSGLENGSGIYPLLYDPSTTTANAACPTPAVPKGGTQLVWNAGPTVNTQWCRTPFGNGTGGSSGNNQIPMARLSPTTAVLYAITPQPSNTENPLVDDNYNAPSPDYTVIPNITFRLDHDFSQSNRAYLRFTYIPNTAIALRNTPDAPATLAATVNGVNYPANASGLASRPTKMYASALGFTHIFSPTFFSETIVSLQNFMNKIDAGGSPNTDFESELGTPNNFGELGFPEFASALAELQGTQYQYGTNEIIATLNENLTKTVGKHQMQFGGEYQRERFTYYFNQATDDIDFDGLATGLENPATNAGNTYTAFSNTGYEDADEFLGAAEEYTANLEPPNLHFHDMEFDGYFQDNYHVARNLTVNLGVRYEAHPAPWTKYGIEEGFDYKNDAEVLANTPANLIAMGYTTQAIINNVELDGGKYETPAQAGLPSVLVDNYDLNLLPRGGFAWQPFVKRGTVIRGAYGRYIFPANIYYEEHNYAGRSPETAGYSESYTSASQAPDDLPDYLVRAPQTETGPLSAGTPVMGVNSKNVVNSSGDTSILPGISVVNLSPDYGPGYATQANLTIEQPMKGNSALRLGWVYSHESNLEQYYYYNEHPSTYVWEMQTGTTTPNGGASTIGTNQYSSTGTGPYDKTTWSGSSYTDQKSGWSNYNALQVGYQRLYHRGVAWQIMYAFAKEMNTGEQGTNGEFYPTADYADSGISTMTSPYGTVIAPALPPPQPAGTADWQGFRALNRYANYGEDASDWPRNHIQFNGIVDLPVGRGKRFLGNSNRALNELVGGWQIAGDGTIVSQTFAITATNWGPTSPLHLYKHKVPITDCRSGTCLHEYEWFNGYIAPTAISGVDCTTNCVSGLPGSWVPYQTPIDNTPGTTYYGGNEVSITLANGKTSAIAFSPGPSGANPYSKSVLNGPMNWSSDLSLFKVFPITERMNLRFNMDAFNAFNVQGQENPNVTDGTQNFLTSYNTARQVQFTLRLTF